MIHINVMTPRMRATLNERRGYERHPKGRPSRNTEPYKSANRERCIAWRKANPGKRMANKNRRRAREIDAGGSFTLAQFKALGNRCLCCGRNEAELAYEGLMLVPDHVIPIVLGGSNDISNIQPLCHGRGGCNNKKHAKYIDYRIAPVTLTGITKSAMCDGQQQKNKPTIDGIVSKGRHIEETRVVRLGI